MTGVNRERELAHELREELTNVGIGVVLVVVGLLGFALLRAPELDEVSLPLRLGRFARAPVSAGPVLRGACLFVAGCGFAAAVAQGFLGLLTFLLLRKRRRDREMSEIH